MRERKTVKLRVDMYEDTKFKIIDRKPERDLIHYVWTRLVVLAGKVNMEGDLFMSRNIPYTVETLAIEFNREEAQIALALKVLMELEMLELTSHNIYRVKNFAKHQNIKVKEKTVDKEAEIEVENQESHKKEIIENNIQVNEDREPKSKISQEGVKIMKSEAAIDLQAKQKDKVKEVISKENSKNMKQGTIPIFQEDKEEFDFEMLSEDAEDEIIEGFYEGERILGENERIIAQWTFE